MAKRHKTKAQKDQEWAAAEQRAWDEFLPKLEALQSFIDAKLLVNQAPRPDSPGRRYYSNLGFFLMAFIPPDGASRHELSLYLQFIQRIHARGELKPGAGAQVEKALRAAMETKGPW